MPLLPIRNPLSEIRNRLWPAPITSPARQIPRSRAGNSPAPGQQRTLPFHHTNHRRDWQRALHLPDTATSSTRQNSPRPSEARPEGRARFTPAKCHTPPPPPSLATPAQSKIRNPKWPRPALSSPLARVNHHTRSPTPMLLRRKLPNPRATTSLPPSPHKPQARLPRSATPPRYRHLLHHRRPESPERQRRDRKVAPLTLRGEVFGCRASPPSVRRSTPLVP